MPEGRGGSVFEADASWSAEQSEAQNLTPSQERSLTRISQDFESGADLDAILERPTAVDLRYADGARKLRDFPELTFSGLSYNSLSEEQKTFIDRVIEISDTQAQELEEKMGIGKN